MKPGGFMTLTWRIYPSGRNSFGRVCRRYWPSFPSSPDRTVCPICEGRNGVLRRAFLRFFFLTVNLPDVPESWIIAAEQGFTKGVDCYDVI
jgi:hypothetical protein